MINGWKTAKDIARDYQLTPKDFNSLAEECRNSKYRDAIVDTHSGTGRNYVYVVEKRWQKFLLAKSLGTLHKSKGRKKYS